jgi:hypothetical protein
VKQFHVASNTFPKRGSPRQQLVHSRIGARSTHGPSSVIITKIAAATADVGAAAEAFINAA